MDVACVCCLSAAMSFKVTPPQSVMVDAEDRASGICLCLGGPSLEELTEALTAFAAVSDTVATLPHSNAQ